jgi:putative redox protein
MIHRVETKWLEELSFLSEISDHHIKLDAEEIDGGENRGPDPRRLLLSSLAGSASMEIISILNKMRIIPEAFNIYVEAELIEEDPKYYHKIHLLYEFKGKSMPLEKLEKSVELVHDGYCGIIAMLKKSADISYAIKYEES